VRVEHAAQAVDLARRERIERMPRLRVVSPTRDERRANQSGEREGGSE